MNSSAKQIQSSVSPNLRVRLSPSLTLKTFLRRLRWSKVKKCYTTAIYTHTGGLIRFYLVIWSVLSQFKWPLLFLHHRGRRRDTRLSIRSQDPNNSSDTETRCLVYSTSAKQSHLTTKLSSPFAYSPQRGAPKSVVWPPSGVHLTAVFLPGASLPSDLAPLEVRYFLFSSSTTKHFWAIN